MDGGHRPVTPGRKAANFLGFFSPLGFFSRG